MSSSDEVEALLARAGISRDELTEESMERIGSASLPHPAAEAASRGAANRSSGSVTEVATPVAGGARGVGARPSRRAGAARAAKPVSSAGSAHSTPLSSDVDGNDVSGFSSFSSMGDSMDFTLESEVQPRRRGAGGRGGANDSPLSNGSLDDSSDDESTRGGGDGGGRRAQLRLRAEFADEIARRDARVSDLHHRNALMERELVRLQRTHEAALRQARDTARDEIRIVREKMASILRELPQLRAQLRAQKMAITPTSVKLSSARYQELLRQPLDELTLVEHVAVQVHPLIARSAEGASMAERDAALAEAARLRALIERGGDDADAELSADASSAAHLKSRLALAAKEKELLSTRVAELTAREQRASDDAAAKAVKIAELEAAREKLYAELLRGREERRVAHEEHVTLELEKLRSAAGARGSTLRDAEGRDARALRDALAAADELREETASLKTTNHELVIQRGLAQSDAQQTIVELRSDLKLKRYEIERLGVSYDEQQQAARKLHLTNEMLSEKLDVIGREFNVMHAETSTKIAYLEAQLEGSVEEASGRAGFAPAPVRPAEAHSIRVTPATPGFAGARAAGASPLSTPSRAAGTPRRLLSKATARDAAVVSLQAELALAGERAAEAERSLQREREALVLVSAKTAQPRKYYLDTLRNRDAEVLAAERSAAQLRVNSTASTKSLELARARIAALETDLRAVLDARHEVDDLRAQVEKLHRDDAWGRRAASAVAAAASQGALVNTAAAAAVAPSSPAQRRRAEASPPSTLSASRALPTIDTEERSPARSPVRSPVAAPSPPREASENIQPQLVQQVVSPVRAPSPKTRRPFVTQPLGPEEPKFHRRMRMVEQIP